VYSALFNGFNFHKVTLYEGTLQKKSGIECQDRKSDAAFEYAGLLIM